jgi:hypothetical protein
MQIKKLSIKSPVLKAVVIFIVVFTVAVIIWGQVKEYYCYAVTVVASKALAEVEDATLEKVTNNGNVYYISLRLVRGGKDYTLSEISTQSNMYLFTVPLTLAFLISLTPFIKNKKRAYTEAFIILFLSHSLYVFFDELSVVTKQFMDSGIESVNITKLFIYQYLWIATQFTAQVFGPFLISVYVFARFRKK